MCIDYKVTVFKKMNDIKSPGRVRISDVRNHGGALDARRGNARGYVMRCVVDRRLEAPVDGSVQNRVAI